MTAAPGGSGRGGWILASTLALAAFVVFWGAAGSPIDAADVYWLDLAVNGRPADHAVEHGAHLVLLQAVVAMSPGDVFSAARTASALLLAVTVLALAIVAGALRPAARGRANVAAVAVFAAQAWVLANAGSVRPELSAMAWVAVGMAICMPPYARDRARRGWLARLVLLGVVTLMAIRSHPGGAILLWPALLLLRGDERRPSPQRIAGRLGVCLLGAGAAWLVVTAVLAATAGRAPESGAVLALPPDTSAWVAVLWPGPAGSGTGAGGLRALALLVTGAAIAAFVTERSAERRMLHLMPLVYVAGLLVGRVLTGGAMTPAALLPILAPACVLGAELFAYAGLDGLGRRQAAAPPFFVPLAALAALVFLVDPYLSGSLTPTRLLPWLGPVAAGDLARRTLAPGAALVLLIGASLLLGRPRMRLPILLATALLALGPGIAASARLLEERRPAERASTALWPWRRLAEELDTAETSLVAVSPKLLASGAMFGPPGALQAIARLSPDAPSLEIATDARAMKRAAYLFVTPDEARARLRDDPAAVSPIGRDPSGRIFLLRSERKPRGPDRETTRELRRRRRRELKEEEKRPASTPD